METFRLLKNGTAGAGSIGNVPTFLVLKKICHYNLFYSRVESNAEMMAEKVLTVKQAPTSTVVAC